MSDLSPLSGEERKSNFGVVRSVDVMTLAVGRREIPRRQRICFPTGHPQHFRLQWRSLLQPYQCSRSSVRCRLLSLGGRHEAAQFMTLLAVPRPRGPSLTPDEG